MKKTVNLIVIFFSSLSIAGQPTDFGVICDSCIDWEKYRFPCKFQPVDSFEKQNSKLSEEIEFYKRVGGFMEQKKLGMKFNSLLEESKNKYVFMKFMYTSDSSETAILAYIFQNRNTYGKIYFLTKRRKILLSAFDLLTSVDVVCQERPDYVIGDMVDYNYYKRIIFPILRKYCFDFGCHSITSKNFKNIDSLARSPQWKITHERYDEGK